jgi:hypothetical protein
VLALVFMSMATQAHGDHDGHGAGHEEHPPIPADSRQQATL